MSKILQTSLYCAKLYFLGEQRGRDEHYSHDKSEDRVTHAVTALLRACHHRWSALAPHTQSWRALEGRWVCAPGTEQPVTWLKACALTDRTSASLCKATVWGLGCSLWAHSSAQNQERRYTPVTPAGWRIKVQGHSKPFSKFKASLHT